MAFGSGVQAQENPEPVKFYIAIAPGLSIGSGPEALHFSSYAVGVALEYGPVYDLDGAAFKASLESGYGQQIGQFERHSFEDPILSSGYTPVIRKVPIMIWWTVETRSNVSPFIRFGAGISWTKYSENYADSTSYTFDASDWGFTWGIGGGIRLRMNPRWSVAIFLDDWVSTEDVAGQFDTPRGTYTTGIRGPIKMTMIGIRGTMNIF
jgi:hypothetical protein